MLIATARGGDGRRMLVIGLEQENIKRLLDDQPIQKDMGAEGVSELAEWDVTILGPEDTVRFVAAVGTVQQ